MSNLWCFGWSRFPQLTCEMAERARVEDTDSWVGSEWRTHCLQTVACTGVMRNVCGDLRLKQSVQNHTSTVTCFGKRRTQRRQRWRGCRRWWTDSQCIDETFFDFTKTQSWQPYGSAVMSCSIFLTAVEIPSLSNMWSWNCHFAYRHAHTVLQACEALVHTLWPLLSCFSNEDVRTSGDHTLLMPLKTIAFPPLQMLTGLTSNSIRITLLFQPSAAHQAACDQLPLFAHI